MNVGVRHGDLAEDGGQFGDSSGRDHGLDGGGYRVVLTIGVGCFDFVGGPMEKAVELFCSEGIGFGSEGGGGEDGDGGCKSELLKMGWEARGA